MSALVTFGRALGNPLCAGLVMAAIVGVVVIVGEALSRRAGS